LFIIDLTFLLISFFLVNYYKRSSFALNPDYEQLLMLVGAVWLIASVTTHKFDRSFYKNIWYSIAPYLKAVFIMTSLGAVLLFALRMFEFSRLQFFGTVAVLFLLETLILGPFFLRRVNRRQSGDIEQVDDVKAIIRREELPDESEHFLHDHRKDFISARSKLHDVFLKNDPKLFDMLDRHLQLNEHAEDQTRVLNTHTMYNVEVLDDHKQSLIINLHKVNDFRWLNRYFLQVHKKIYNGGYFVGKIHTNTTHKNYIFNKYPGLIARFVYNTDFVWRRIFPKIPMLQQFYFAVSRGKNRALSKAEVLGRLSFCGFKIVAVEEFNDSVFFIVKRQKMPSMDKNPSYGPTIKLNRIGLDGKIIRIYKLRTMHPYSEYLQDYIFEQHNLSETGKFANDFRLTEWGKLFRKLWLDELPQLKNYLRGEVNLVGVRALSKHYFSLYPEDLQKLRIQFKPGLVPPYYADMPKSFDEIVASERRYLLAKQNNPLLTDIRYFFKAMHNIFFKKARSG
ncbi:MAG: sugar transferase, partial [Calditrichae bacterium]|nr:sugar transferase [Calditrichia bacterium]